MQSNDLQDLITDCFSLESIMVTPSHRNSSQMNVRSMKLDSNNPFLDEEIEEKREKFGVILSRRYHGLDPDLCHGPMVRKTVSMRMEKQDSALESAVRRAFSMRKTNSDSPMGTTYGRIAYDEDEQGDEDEENMLLTPSSGHIKKRNKLFQAWARLFRF